MFTVNLVGGLGNQMCCYALYLRLRAQYPDERIVVNYDTYKYENFHNGLRIREAFALDYPFDIKEKYSAVEKAYYKLKVNIWTYWHKHILRNVVTDKMDFSDFEKKYDSRKNYYFLGTWGSESYFLPYKDIVRNAYSFAHSYISTITKSYVRQIEKCNAVSLHIRRGDYLDNGSAFLDLTTTSYYDDAYAYIADHSDEKDFHLFVFSDDIEWCRNNVPMLRDKTVTYISGTRDYEDLYLMSLCKYAITANSSFSWWGAYLSDAKIICGPKRKLHDNRAVDKLLSFLYPPSWVLL